MPDAPTPPDSPAAPAPESPTPEAPSSAPRWRRALTWLWTKSRTVAVWLWTKLRAYTRLVVRNVRDAEAPRSKRVLWAAGGLAGLGGVVAAASTVLLVLYTLVLWPFTPSVFDLRDAREVHPSVVLSADGQELTRYARQNREWRTLDEIAPEVIEALVATEDRRFYRHGGIDVLGLGAVAVGAVTGDGLRGASTITQQLARNLFPDEVGNAASVTRKLKEAITAVKLEVVYSKDEILELYLNTVPFLYNAHGIEMAARTYFSVDAPELDRLQAATLVGMLKGTSSYNPYRNPERATARRNVVLGQMVRFAGLDAAEADRLAERPLGLRFERQPMLQSEAPHFTEHVRVQLEDWADREGYSLYGDGLTIHTTLDWRMQERAEQTAETFGNALQSVADVEWARADASLLGRTTSPYVTASRRVEPFERFWDLRRPVADAFVRATPTFQRRVAAGQDSAAVLAELRGSRAFRDSLRAVKMRLEVALTAVDPRSGHVKVWVGSRDYQASAYDHVARARRQPGSTFKPFLFARALEEGYRPDDTLLDADVAIEMADGVVWQPTNASGTTTDELVSLRNGLAFSKNTIAARLVDDIGARDLARTARRLGIQSELEAVPALALGTSEVSLLEMAGAYSTIAAGGVRRDPIVVTHITDRDGNEVARFAPDDDVVMDEDVATDLVDMMRDVVDRGTGTQVRRLFGARGDLAGKTGTTQDGADGWFLLMRPDLVTGAWVGFDDPRVTFRSSYWGQGGHTALRLVGDVNRDLQNARLVDTALAFPEPPPEAERGPSLWGRFTTWVGGVTDGIFERDDPLVPEGYGPRTPGRRAEPGGRDRRDDDGWDRRARDILAENERWLEGEWDALDRIDDPTLRAVARGLLAEAARSLRDDGGRAGWRDRWEDAQDRALDEAERQIEREIEDALRQRVDFPDDPLFEEDEIIEEPEAPPPLEEVPVDPDLRSGDGGRIGF